MSDGIRWVAVVGLAAVLAPFGVAGEEKAARDPAATPKGFAIVGGKVVTMAGDVHHGGMVLTRGKTIASVLPATPKDYKASEGFEAIDATELWVVPGIVETHSHAGGSDLNDMVYPTNAGYATVDNVQPENPLLQRAQAGGVTTILFLPGSGTNIAGFGTLMKTAGMNLDDLIIRFPACLKLAQGGNPERRSGDLGNSRMGMNWLIRKALQDGKAYTEAWDAYEQGKRKEKPVKNPRLEFYRPVFHREIPVLVHTQGYHLIQSTLRIVRDEMKLRVILGHSTFDSHLLAGEVAARDDVHVTNGPRQLRMDQRTGQIVGLAGAWNAGGVAEVSLNTDAPVVPQEELFFQAAMAVKLGLDNDVALRGLTSSAAKILGIADRVGSLEVGKDADIVLWTGHPLDVRSHVVVTIVNGRIAYDTRKEPRRF